MSAAEKFDYRCRCTKCLKISVYILDPALYGIRCKEKGRGGKVCDGTYEVLEKREATS
jgi:hypothetical protein